MVLDLLGALIKFIFSFEILFEIQKVINKYINVETLRNFFEIDFQLRFSDA